MRRLSSDVPVNHIEDRQRKDDMPHTQAYNALASYFNNHLRSMASQTVVLKPKDIKSLFAFGPILLSISDPVA